MFPLFRDRRVRIKPLIQKMLQARRRLRRLRGKTRQPPRIFPDVFHALRSAFFHLLPGIFDQIRRHIIEHPLQRFVELQLPPPARMPPLTSLYAASKAGTSARSSSKCSKRASNPSSKSAVLYAISSTRSISWASSGGRSSSKYSASAGNSSAV